MSTASPPNQLELVAFGRVGVDLYPQQIGVPLAEVKSFAKSLGGSPINVAVAAARLGHRVAVVTKVGADGFGAYVRTALAQFDVWPGWVTTDKTLHTPVVFAEAHPPDHFPMLFYREPRAPDMGLTPDDFDAEAVVQSRVLWVTGQGLSREPSRSTTLEAMRRRGKDRITVLDLDHREGHWSSVREERRWLRRATAAATVVTGNQQEVELVVGRSDPAGACRALQQMGPEVVVIKQGPAGAYGARLDGEEVSVAAIPVETVCGLGAGDAFGGGLVHGLLSGWDLASTLRFANAAGGIVASRLACADAMPTPTEIEDVLRHTQ